MIKETRGELDLLKTNAQTIEKYAREKYYMKKDNEDLFIVNPEEKK
jgi:cell division protein FtsB